VLRLITAKNAVVDRLKTWGWKSFLKFYFALLGFMSRHTSKIQITLGYLISLKIRTQLPEARQEGADTDLDAAIHIARLLLTSPHIFDETECKIVIPTMTEKLESFFAEQRAQYEKHKAEADRIHSIALRNGEIRRLVAMFYLVEHYRAKLFRDEEKSTWSLNQAKIYKADATPLQHSALGKLNKQVKQDLKVTRVALEDREAFKVDISLQQFGYVAAFLSSLFLFTGYLYNSWFLGQFGINASHYFALGDYIISAIDEIRYAGISALLGVGAIFVGFHSATRKSVARTEYEKAHSNKKWWAAFFLFSALLWCLSSKPPEFYSRLAMIVFFATLPVYQWVAIRYFKNPIPVLFILIFTASYLLTMLGSLQANIYRAKNGIELPDRSQFQLTEDIGVDAGPLILLTANSRFFFFWNAETGTSLVVPEDKVELVKAEVGLSTDMHTRGMNWLKRQFQPQPPPSGVPAEKAAE
jgi:hypothetical protein